ncbi:MAG: RNA polymerase sigma factor [Deltaproteobacteria bacterium]|nr:RNA polymerase sigma factor [Deltaproteobacteria bacterium]
MQSIATVTSRTPTTRNHAAEPLDELALAARAGDARAMGTLLARVSARVRPLVRHKIALHGAGVLSIDDADDVVQEVVLAAWRFDVPRFRPERGSFATFLSRRLAWHVLDAVRQRARHGHLSLDDQPVEAAGDADPETLLASAALETSLQMLVPQLELALADLDDVERYVVQRHDLEGARLSDVASELGRNVSNACRARQRALRQLSKKLEALAA